MVMIPYNRVMAFLVTGMLLASLHALGADPAAAAERALEEAEVAIARARLRDALWSSALAALQEARRSRRSQDYAASQRWSARATELADLGMSQAGHQADPFPTGRASTTGENR
jgi:hypothetical protein